MGPSCFSYAEFVVTTLFWWPLQLTTRALETLQCGGIRVIYSSDQDGRELFCYTSKICQDFNGLVVSTLLHQKKTLYQLQENNCYIYSEGQKSSPDKNFSPGFVSNVTCEIFAYQWNKKLRECITIMFFVSFLENFWSIQV